MALNSQRFPYLFKVTNYHIQSFYLFSFLFVFLHGKEVLLEEGKGSGGREREWGKGRDWGEKRQRSVCLREMAEKAFFFKKFLYMI